MLTYPRTPRALCREVLDSDSPDPAAAATEFQFLRRLNRATGASAALLDAIERRIAPRPQQAITLADFGTGAGDIAIEAVRKASRRGWTLCATLTDHAAEALRHARAAADAVGEQGIQFGKYDLLDEEDTLEAAPFQVVHASLVLHHFSDEGVVHALHRMSRCASDLLVWNDLIRNRIGLLGARVATLGRSAMLRHDAILSVRRSFTLVEARAFAEAAGLVEITVRRWRGARFVLTAKPAPPDQNFPTPRPEWAGTLSLWMSLDPAADLDPGFCDPIQLTSKKWDDAALFLEFEKRADGVPFRLGVYADTAVWNPLGRKWEEIPAPEKPLITLTKTPFSRSRWTHAAFVIEHFNTGTANGRAQLFIDGKDAGTISPRQQTFTWDPAQSVIMLGVGYVGLMDDLALFDRALTPAEISHLFTLKDGLRTLTPQP